MRAKEIGMNYGAQQGNEAKLKRKFYAHFFPIIPFMRACVYLSRSLAITAHHLFVVMSAAHTSDRNAKGECEERGAFNDDN
jgi:hypothetical protein